MENNSTYQIRVSESLKIKFQEVAKKNGTDGSEVIRKYMEKYINEKEKEKDGTTSKQTGETI